LGTREIDLMEVWGGKAREGEEAVGFLYGGSWAAGAGVFFLVKPCMCM
jgi:hypothetical protein